MKKVLVLDFGGQYNLLVARRVRECGVYCEIKPYTMSMDDIRAFDPAAIIFTGGPATVFEPNAPALDNAIFELGLPILGICYGQQLMIHQLGGACRRAEVREYGKVELTQPRRRGRAPFPRLPRHRAHRGLRLRRHRERGPKALRRAVPSRGAAHRPRHRNSEGLSL